MSTKTKVTALDHAMDAAHTWINDVAKQFDTEDREFAYRVLRARLHTLRDRLTVEASAQFCGPASDLIRGIFYQAWNPHAVPDKYDAEAYTVRFSREANIALDDVGKAATATTAAALHHLPVTQMDKALSQLPTEIRKILQPQQ